MRSTKPNLKLAVTTTDIAKSRCANRRQCVIAQALDRQLNLRGAGYIRVDANALAYTKEGKRYIFHTPRGAMNYLRSFDRLGEQKGEAEARLSMKPDSFNFKLISVKTIAPKASRERKNQINAARNKKNAERRKAGQLPRTYKRYTGLTVV